MYLPSTCFALLIFVISPMLAFAQPRDSGVLQAERQDGVEYDDLLPASDRPTTAQEASTDRLTTTSERFNFSIRSPGPTWTVEKKIKQNRIELHFKNRIGMKLRLIAEVLPRAGVEIRRELLGARYLERIRARVPEADIWTAQTQLGSSDAIYIRASDEKAAAVYWTAVLNGIHYEIFGMVPPVLGDTLASQGELLAKSFQLLDPNFVATFESKKDVRELAYNNYGYTLALPDDWAEVPEAPDPFATHHEAPNDPESIAVASLPLPTASIRSAMVHDALVSLLPNYDLSTNWTAFQQDSLRGRKYDPVSLPSHPGRKAYLRTLVGADLAYLILIDAPDDARAAELLETFSASQSPPATPSQDSSDRLRNGLFYNELGLRAFEAREYRDALNHFTKTIEMEPDILIAYSNLANSCVTPQDFAHAAATFDKHASRLVSAPQALVDYARVLEAVKRDEEAVAAYDHAFALPGSRSNEEFNRYVNCLYRLKQFDKALALLSKSQRSDLDVIAMTAQIKSAQGKHAEAIAIANNKRANSEFDPALEYLLIDLYASAKQHENQLAVANRLIAKGSKTADAYYFKGDAEFQLKRYDEAKKSLEQAAELSPDSVVIQDGLMRLSALLGQSDNSIVKRKIPPVTIPKALARRTLPAWDPPEANQTGAIYKRHFIAYRFRPGKEFITTKYISAVLLNDSGVSQFKTLGTTFDPVKEDIYVNALLVFDEHGKPIAKGNQNDFIVTDDTSSGILSHDKVLQVPVPGLRPGCRVEFMVTRRDRSPPRAFPFESHVLASTLPTQQMVIFVDAKPGDFDYELANGLTAETADYGLRIERRELAPFVFEPLQQNAVAFVPTVYLGDKSATWEQEAADYLALIQDRLSIPRQIASVAESLVADETTTEGKVAALAAYVQQKIRYQAIEFGPRALVMNRSDQVLANGYGDCKDHSILLCHLLRSVHVPAELSLANASGSIREAFPSIDQFDHMVVYVPQLDKFIDCTDKVNHLMLPNPNGLEGSTNLVLGDPPVLKKISPATSDNFEMKLARKVSFDAEGSAMVHEKVRFREYFAGAMRGFFVGQTDIEKKSTVQSFLDSAGQEVALRTLKITGVRDLDQPLAIELRYQMRNVLNTAGDRLVGRLPAVWEHYFMNSQFVASRLTPFRLIQPMRITSVMKVSHPAGFSKIDVFPAKHEADKRFVSWRSSIENKEKSTIYRTSLLRKGGNHAADLYDDYHETIQNARRVLGPTVEISK